MKILSELQDFFYDNIYSGLEFLEQKRLKIYASLKRIAVGIFIATCTVFYTFADVFTDTFGIFGFICKMKASGFVSLFKDQVIEKLVEFVGDSLRYSKMDMISEYEYKQSALFTQKIDRYSGDDLVAGKVDGVDIRFSEVHTEVKKKGNKGQEYWQTIFKGLFFIADFNKNFKGKTVVLPDVSEKFLGSISHFFNLLAHVGS